MIRRILSVVVGLTLAVMAVPSRATASTILFDNGPVDPLRTTWNMGGSIVVFDDFVLGSPATITSIAYNAFAAATGYVSTNWSILDSLGGTVLASGTVVGTTVSNGLTSTNGVVPLGFLHTLGGLSVSLSAGNYVLGLSANGGVQSIASGPGSGQTIGPGLTQVQAPISFLRAGDHMSFQLINDTAVPAPEPTSLLLLGTGLAAAVVVRRRRRQ